MTLPYRGYLLCGEPRSGTTFLRTLFESTGALGSPQEYFGFSRVPRIGALSSADISEILRRATTPNGIYGIKLFSYQFDLVRQARVIDQLPAPSFIYVERRDLLGQAISLVRAKQTASYVTHQVEQRTPSYNGRAIANMVASIAANQARWREYFAVNGIEPLILTSEEFIAQPASAVASVASLLDLPSAPDFDPQLLPRQQSDALSEEWRARFMRERADMNILPSRYVMGRMALRRLLRDLRTAYQARQEYRLEPAE